MTKYVSACASLRPGQLDKLMARTKDHNPQKECFHKDSSIKQVMDFSFLVCNKCGFQWKA